MASDALNPETPEEKKARLFAELQSCDLLLENEPENPDLLFQKGFIYNQLGQYEEAINYLTKSLNLNPTVKKYQQLGLAYCEIGEYNESISAYNAALELEPNNPETHNYKGFAHYLAGDFKEAISECRVSISLDENYTDALLNLGFILDDMGYHDEAILSYDKIISINPRDCCAYLNKGVSLLSNKKYLKAISEFEKSIEIRNDDSCSHFNKGYAHYCCKDYTAALKEFDVTLRLDENYAEAYYFKGLILDKLNEKENALSCYTKALELNYYHPKLFKSRGDIYKLMKLYPEAIADYNHVLKHRGSYTMGHILYNIGFCYCQNKQYSKALNVLSEIKSTNILVDLIMGDSYYGLNKYKEAILSYYKIIDFISKNNYWRDDLDYLFESSEEKNLFERNVIKKFYDAIDKLPQSDSEFFRKIGIEIFIPKQNLKNVLCKYISPSLLRKEYIFSNSAVIELNRRLGDYLSKIIREATRNKERYENRQYVGITLTLDDFNRAIKRLENFEKK